MNSDVQRMVLGFLIAPAAGFSLGWHCKPDEISSRHEEIAVTGHSLLKVSAMSKMGDSVRNDLRTDKIQSDELFSQDEAVSRSEMESAIELVLGERDPLKRMALMSEFLRDLTQADAPMAFDLLQRNSMAREDGLTELFLHAWGRIDGVGAVNALLDADVGLADVAGVLTGWAASGSDSLTEWLDGNVDGRTKGVFAGAIIRGLLIQGVDEAVDFVRGLPGGCRRRHMPAITEEMLEQGTHTAAAWASELDDLELRGGAMSWIAREYARDQLDTAVGWVTKHASEDYALPAVGEVAEQWAEYDSQAAVVWAQTLPGNAQTIAFQRAFEKWAVSEPVDASEFLAEFPSSPQKDVAIGEFAKELSHEDPESAAVWAETITDLDLREDALRRVARVWYHVDKQTATTWMSGSDLPTDVFANIRERPISGWSHMNTGQ